jgi:hypothetical protein
MGRIALILAAIGLLAADEPENGSGAKAEKARLEIPKGWRAEDTTYPPPWAKRAYDGGLYGGGLDPAKIRIEIGEARTAEKQGHAVVRRSVTIDGFDPFVTRRRLKTYLEIFRWYCPQSNRTAVLILRSPRPSDKDDPVWKALLPFWEDLACHPSHPEDHTRRQPRSGPLPAAMRVRE